MDLEFVRITLGTEIAEVLRQFNNYFPRSLEGRVGNLDSYAIKLSELAYVYVGKVNGETAGVVVFYANDLSKKIAYLSQIAVSTVNQNKGIGSLLLQLSFDLSKKNGMNIMKLEVDTSNSKAISHYEKHGFIKKEAASPNSQYMIKELI